MTMQDEENHPWRSPLWYREFRRKVRSHPEEAAQEWSAKSELERIETVWTATIGLHLDFLEWALLTNGNRWIDVSQMLDENGCGLLHYVGSNITITVEKMLAAFDLLVNKVKCKVDVVNHAGLTPLHCVCGSHVKRNRRGRRKYIRILKILVEAGADVNRQFQGITPLHLVHESPWAMRYLLLKTQVRADVEDTFQRSPLIWALRNPHKPAIHEIPVSVFQEKGLNFKACDYMGHSVIHYAVLRAQSDKLGDVILLIKRLVRAGADVNHRNRRLRTPLYYLLYKPDLRELAVFLINECQLDVNLCDSDGYTVVHLAAIFGRLDYVALFLPKLTKNVKARNGETVRSCLNKYCDPSAIKQVESLLIELERKGDLEAECFYPEAFTVWEYVHLLDKFRDHLSLYIVDTFYRYRGGRWLFSDFFHHISHSSVLKIRAKSFLEEFSNWNGSVQSLLNVIDKYSIVFPQENQGPGRDEPSQISYFVSQLVKKLMEKVRLEDAKSKKFGWLLDILPVGSAVDGSKILLPDEYDFLIVFKRFGSCTRIPLNEDFVSQVEEFRMHLIHCMQNLDLEFQQQNPALPFGFEFVECELRRVCLNIRLTWWGDKSSPYHGMPVSIDLTPVFHFDGWENHPGLRPLRPLHLLPDWFKRDQVVEHFRPLQNCVRNQPCAATMETRCLSHPSNRILQYCSRLLKLVVQCQHIVEDETPPNSHFLKLALMRHVQEEGMPKCKNYIPSFVYKICWKLKNASWRWKIEYFVANSHMSSPPMFLNPEIFDILKRKNCSSIFFQHCTLS